MESNVKDTLFNPDVERIAMQNTLGMIYYICAFDCGFDFYGFMMCFSRVKDRIVIRAGDSRKIE